MNEIITNENIVNMIYEISGKQVMLDSDLAKLYKVETKRINEAVKNNSKKFPERFSWKLTDKESRIFLVENFDQKKETRGGKYKNPRVFTEQAVYMLATILKSDVATEVSIRIMDTFVAMHNYISNEYLEQRYMQNMLIRHDNDIKELQESLKKFEEKKKVNEIYFNGQIYDAYSKIIDILNSAKKDIIIIDSYSDKTTLDIISKIKNNIILITTNKASIKNIDLNKYQKQYKNLKIVYNDTFHDRYIIIDNKTIYHLGTSINHAGSRTFSINILEDELIKKVLINHINKIIKTSK